jgi:hypothetical protein
MKTKHYTTIQNRIQLSLNELANGIYILRLFNNNELLNTQKISIQK